MGPISTDFCAFCYSFGDRTWKEVGNGYFLDLATNVLVRLQEYGVVDLGTDEKVRGLVIGSNGGGLSYVASPDGAIHRTRTASLDGPVAAR